MKINKLIDHTLLKADATSNQISKLCEEAREYDFKSVCVNPGYVSLCASLLSGTDVVVCTVIGFPLGATSTLAKVEEAKIAVSQGAKEVDMVINIGHIKDRRDKDVQEEIHAIKNAVGKDIILKVIIETCLLTDEEKVRACTLSKQGGADYVKTSTGFSTGGATATDIALMRKTVGETMGVKASGGVRTIEDVKLMVENGATRIGTSNGIAIIKGLEGSGY